MSFSYESRGLVVRFCCLCGIVDRAVGEPMLLQLQRKQRRRPSWTRGHAMQCATRRRTLTLLRPPARAALSAGSEVVNAFTGVVPAANQNVDRESAPVRRVARVSAHRFRFRFFTLISDAECPDQLRRNLAPLRPCRAL